MGARRLLIVDDDYNSRSGLAEILRTAGFDCTEAGTYQQAIAALRANPPDLLITDIRLGAYNGLQLVINRPAHVAALVITGFPDAVLESEAARSGARVIHKPIRPRELVDMISDMLGPAVPNSNGGRE